MNNQKKIWLSSPHMGGKEQFYVNQAFEGNWVAPVGENIDLFENQIEKFTSCGHAAVLTSGTAALHLALILLGVQRDDYVLCQSLTFCASANPVKYVGAIPIFVDSEEQTWNMCPDTLEQAIISSMKGEFHDSAGNKISGKKQKPKAIIPVHLYGMPANMDRIMEIAQKYDIPVIEDAAEALGSTYKGKACGTFGDFGVFSFNGNKIITTSGGGAIVSKNKSTVEKARFFATQARDSAAHYQHSELGFNYRISNISAGIGRGQMEVLEERVAQRRANFTFYKQHLGKIAGISFLDEPSDSFCNYWLTCLQVDLEKTAGVSQEDIRNHLSDQNIESRPIWKPMHLQPLYKGVPFFGNKVSETLFEKGICLPSGSNMTDEDRDRVLQTILELFNN